MADEPAVTSTEAASQPVNGFARLAAAVAEAPPAPPEPGATAVVEVAWPQDDSGLPPAQGERAALRILNDALVAHAAGTEFDVQQRAEQEMNRGEAEAVGVMIRALAAQTRLRVAGGDELGQALQDTGFAAVADNLDALAARLVPPDTEGPTATIAGPPAPIVARAAMLFDILRAENVRQVFTTPSPPTPAEASAAFPELVERELRTRGILRRALDIRVERAQAEPDQYEPGVVMALAVASDALNTADFNVPAGYTAVRLAAHDPLPLHTARRLSQLADIVDSHLPDPERQRTTLGTFSDGRHLSEHLRTIGATVERIAASPTGLAQARVARLLGTLGGTDYTTDSILSAVTQAATAPARPPTAVQDAATQDAATPDAATPDAATPDAATPDATTPDATTPATSAVDEAAPAVDEAAPGDGTRGDSDEAGEATAYRYDPDLLPEHALLGSLLHAPRALDELAAFLGPRDFSNPDTQAVFTTLRGLYQSGALFDVAALTTDADRLQAANENVVKLWTALKASPPPYGNHTVTDVPGLIGQINAAAPVESVPYRGVYDPVAQLRLGRMVLEDSIRRQLGAMGVHMERATPLVAPAQIAPDRAEKAAQAVVGNLETIEAQLTSITQRFVEAVRRTEPGAANSATEAAEAEQTEAVAASARRWRVPDKLQWLTQPLQHRAELHVLHLALHAGRMRDVPQQVLDLQPEHFSDTRHANIWRTIQDLRRRELPVNYVSVFRETRDAGFAHQPVLSDRALTRLADPPEIRPDRVARSLRTLVASALARATKEGRQAIASAAADRDRPVREVLDEVRKDVNALGARAKTALAQHQQITATTTAGRPTR
ncbi:hypothetical protein SUDANB95_08032 (plasmid) [Actinosynnema sp. ALI-1.44]